MGVLGQNDEILGMLVGVKASWYKIDGGGGRHEQNSSFGAVRFSHRGISEIAIYLQYTIHFRASFVCIKIIRRHKRKNFRNFC